MKAMVKQTIYAPQKYIFLILILVLALSLRIWGIGFGLPYIYHFDEHFYVATALKLGSGILNNPPYAPTGLSNILVLQYATYFILGRLLGLWNSASGFEAAYRLDPSGFYLIGRLTSALTGSFSVVLIYILARKILPLRYSLIPPFLLAISFLHVRDSHYSVPDIVMTFFVLFSVTMGFLATFGKQKYLFLGYFLGGLAIATKWTALPVVVPAFIASYYIYLNYKQNHHLFNSIIRLFIFPAFLVLIGFIIGSPQILLNPLPYLREAFGQYGAGQTGGFEIWQVDTVSGWLFYLKTLLYGIGYLLFIFSIIGIIRRVILVIKERDKTSILLLSFPLIYFLLMGSTRHYFARYAIPLVPFTILFASEAIVYVSQLFGSKIRRSELGLTYLFVLIACIQPLIASIQYDVISTQVDTRTQSKQWIEANFPAESKIAIERETLSPPLSTQEEIFPYSSKLFKVDIMNGSGLSEHSIQWYKDNGFDFLIASSFIYNIPLVDKDRNEERKKFYDSLDGNLKLVKVFRPYKGNNESPFIFDEIYGPVISLSQRALPGPVIKIYQVNN